VFIVENFKNFEKAEVDLDQPVTLLVGPNGSGKSNLIEALELLAVLMAGRALHEVTELGREGGLEIRGALALARDREVMLSLLDTPGAQCRSRLI